VSSSDSPILFEGEVIIVDHDPRQFSSVGDMHPEMEAFVQLDPGEELYVQRQGDEGYRVMKLSKR